MLIYLGFIWVMFSYYLINKKYLPYAGALISAIVLIAFIYHYKGEIIMYNVSFMKIIYFIFICCSLFSLTKAREARSQYRRVEGEEWG